MLRVTAVLAAHSGVVVLLALDGFEVEYVTEDGAAHRVELASVWPVRFELAAPVRGWPVTSHTRRTIWSGSMEPGPSAAASYPA